MSAEGESSDEVVRKEKCQASLSSEKKEGFILINI